MTGQNIFCLIMIIVPIAWIGIAFLAKKGKLVGWVDYQLKHIRPERRAYVLDLRRTYQLITEEQYLFLQKKYGLVEADPDTGPVSSELAPIIELNDEQVKTAKTMAIVSASFPFKQRVRHFNQLYVTGLKLLKEVNLYRHEKGIDPLEIQL
jgi:hypothetical protein